MPTTTTPSAPTYVGKRSADYTLRLEYRPDEDAWRPWVSTLTRDADADPSPIFMCRRMTRKYALIEAIDHANFDHREITRSSKTPHVTVIEDANVPEDKGGSHD